MAKIIVALANQKGGVGKSTLTLNLAGAVCDEDLRNREEGGVPLRVLVIDADPQNTASRSAGAAKVPLPFAVVSLADRDDMGREIKRLAEGYDIVFIDCAPTKKGRPTEQAMRAADFVLMPLDASPADAWSTAGMLEVLDSLVDTDVRRAAIVFNRANPRLASFGQIKRALTKASPFRILDSTVAHREVYRVCMGTGTTVFTIKGQRRSKDAQQEIHAVLAEVLQVMGLAEKTENAEQN